MQVLMYGVGMGDAWTERIECHHCGSVLLVGANDLVAKTNMNMVSGLFEIGNFWYYFMNSDGIFPKPEAQLKFELECGACGKKSFFVGDVPKEIQKYIIMRPTLNVRKTTQ